MKKIFAVFGTRPEAIKMCPLILELQSRKELDVRVCVTGQHKEMLEQVLDVFGVKPDYDLRIMKPGQSLFDITINIMNLIKSILEKESPDVVLVHGDTTTAFAAALSCFYLNIPVGHVEAGLRTYDIHNPYPEEFNRQAIGIVSQYHFAPTKRAAENLINEGKNPKDIYITGNTVIDAMQTTVRDDFENDEMEWIGDSKWILITAHRRENLGQPLRNIYRALKRILQEYPEYKAVYPIHMNPKIREIAYEEFKECKNIHIIEPVDVVTCHNFEARCYICLTDSGGIQEECPAYGKPILVLRNTSERPEGIEAGTSILVGTEEENIYCNIKRLIDEPEEYNKMVHANNPYGDGKASERIADILTSGQYIPFMN